MFTPDLHLSRPPELSEDQCGVTSVHLLKQLRSLRWSPSEDSGPPDVPQYERQTSPAAVTFHRWVLAAGRLCSLPRSSLRTSAASRSARPPREDAVAGIESPAAGGERTQQLAGEAGAAGGAAAGAGHQARGAARQAESANRKDTSTGGEKIVETAIINFTAVGVSCFPTAFGVGVILVSTQGLSEKEVFYITVIKIYIES